MKRLVSIVIALCLFTASALAQSFTGTTVCESPVNVYSPTDGTITSVNVYEGQTVKNGELLAQIKETPVFSSCDGVVSMISYKSGEKTTGTVITVIPVQKYKVYCSVDGAYDSPESTFVHGGQQAYIRCRTDKSHLGQGIISSVSGNEYFVLTDGGEFIPGETVNIYSDIGFADKTRIGYGTVVENDPIEYTATGTVGTISVAVGEFVEKGELLFTYTTGETGSVYADSVGIVVSAASVGASARKDGILFKIAPQDQITVNLYVTEDEIDLFYKGQEVTITYDYDDAQTPCKGTVLSVSKAVTENGCLIKIAPTDTSFLRLDLGCTVDVE